MKSRLKDLITFLFFWIVTVYLEILLVVAGGIKLYPGNILYFFLFSIPVPLVVFLLTGISKNKKVNLILRLVFISLLILFYAIQYFSRAFFQNYMSIESILAGGKGLVTDFADETFVFVGQRFYIALLLILPIPVLILFSRFNLIKKENSTATGRLLAVGITSVLFSLGLIIVSNNEADKMAYEDNYEFDTSASKFGMCAAIRLDAEYLFFGHGGATDFSYDTTLPVTAAETENIDAQEPEILQSTVTEETTADNSSGSSQVTGNLTSDTSGEDPAEEEQEPEPEPIVYGTHDCGLDFEALAESESNSKIAGIHRYIASLTPTSENMYTGLFKGKNLIFITAEAFSAELISEEMTPVLYRMSTKGINFTNYYQPVWGGSTSTGEFSNMTGIIPVYGIGSMRHSIGKNMYYTIGNQLRRQNYYSMAFHAHAYDYYDRHLTHENLGYDKYMGRGNGLEDLIKSQWPESDLEMLQATTGMYIDEQPFSIYYMSVSGHTNYNWTGNAMSGKNKEAVSELEVPTPIKAYIACNLEFEYAMEYLLDTLEEKGILDDTVIVIGDDHYPFGLEQDPSDTYRNALGDLYGYDYSNIFERDHNRLIIWSRILEDSDPIIVDDPVYSLDIIPTLSNLFGTDYDSRLFVGRDVLSDDMPLILWPNYSWITDKAIYNASTGKCTPLEGYEDEVTDEYIKAVKTMVSNRFSFSRNVLDYDYFNVLFGSDE